jgi:hypothetical protein
MKRKVQIGLVSVIVLLGAAPFVLRPPKVPKAAGPAWPPLAA